MVDRLEKLLNIIQNLKFIWERTKSNSQKRTRRKETWKGKKNKKKGREKMKYEERKTEEEHEA